MATTPLKDSPFFKVRCVIRGAAWSGGLGVRSAARSCCFVLLVAEATRTPYKRIVGQSLASLLAPD